MARVLELLAEDCSVKDIAGRMGYHSPQYFIKVFKEIYGLTPYQYKKQKLGKGEKYSEKNGHFGKYKIQKCPFFSFLPTNTSTATP